MLKKRGTEHTDTSFLGRHRPLMAIATLVGTIVGAGILGIPYVVAKAGFLYGLILIVVIGLAFLFLNLCAGEIILRTREQHQLTGYAEKYLGSKGKKLMTFSMLVSIYGALTAYLIGEGSALHTIFSIGSPVLYALIFFAIATFIIYKGMKATGKAELLLIVLLLVTVFAIGIFSYEKINPDNFTRFNPAFLFLPYGVILFASVGTPAIPELQEVLGKEKRYLRKVITIGSLIPIILYLLFTTIVVGIIGVENFDLLEPNERIATIALKIYSEPLFGTFANLIAVLAMFTSFLTLGTALTEIYQYDYNFSHKISFVLTFTVPLLVFLFKLTTFIAVLGVTGAVAGGLDGIIIMLMYWKAKKHGNRAPEYSLKSHRIISYSLMLMFAAGIVYQLWINFS